MVFDKFLLLCNMIKKSTPLAMALEPRILLDGAALADAVIAVDSAISSTSSDTSDDKLFIPQAVEPVRDTRREIVFIDASLPDYQQLIEGVSGASQIYLVSSDVDGFAFMADMLAGETNVDAIHVLGHGTSGAALLGGSVLTTENLASYADTLSAIGQSLTIDGDILFYGCDVGAGEQGSAFIDQIASLTQADVAASDDATGAQSLGGDWDLEYETGSIEAAEFAVPDWNYILHTNSVGFDIVNNSGTLTLYFFYGSWHSNPSAEGALSLYTLRSGGDRDNYADYTVEAYGEGGAISDQTYGFVTTNTTLSPGGITFANTNDSNGFTNTELDNAGFTLGTNYYFADSSKLYGYRNSSDSSSYTSADTTGKGAYGGSQVYKHQWAVITGIQAGTYTAYYDENPVGETKRSSLTANWTPQTAIRQMIFTIASDGSISLGSSSALSKTGVEDTNITFANTDFTNNYSGTLGDVKIKSLPTQGLLYLDTNSDGSGDSAISIGDELDATQRAQLIYVPNANTNGSDTFNIENSELSGGTSTYVGENTAVNFSITAVNDEPGLTATAADPSFTEGDSNGVALFTGATFTTTPDGTQNISQIVLTSSGLVDGTNERLIVGGSEFGLVNTSSVSAPANVSSGTPAYSYVVASNGASVTLSGTWTTTQAKALVESIKYKNYSDDIDAAGTRVFTITSVKDAGGTANSGDDTKTVSIASTVSLTAVNDEPTLTATGLSPTFTENQSAVKLYTNAAASTVESDQSFSSLTLTITNVTDGADEKLTIDGSEIALTDGTSSTTATNSLTASVALSGSTATVTISGGSLTSAQLETLIEAIAYRHASEDPTDANRVVTITAVTDSGLNTGSNDNTLAVSIVSTVNVNPVNDLPVVTLPSGAYQTEKTSGNATGSFSLTGLGLSDADDATLTSVVLSLSQVSSAQYGTLSIANTAGVTTAGGATISGDGTDEITLTGTVSQIHAALAAGVTYGALTGQDVVDDGPNTLTITATDATGGVTTVTKNITVMPAKPNAQSINILAVEDTNKLDIQSLVNLVEIPGDTVTSGGAFSISHAGTNDVFNKFDGDASITSFTLDWTPSAANEVVVYVGGVVQTLTTDYTVSGNLVTFVSPPALGTDNIVIESNTGSLTSTAGQILDHPTLGSSVKGLDLGNGVLYLQESQSFSGDGSAVNFTLTDALFASEAKDDLTLFIEAADGSQASVSADDFSVSGLVVTLTTAPINGSTLVVRGGPTGDITNPGNVGSLMFVPDAGFAGTEEFYYSYTKSGLTSPVAKGLIYVEGVNDSPTVSVSGSKSVNEEATLTFAGSDIELADSDVGSGLMELSLSVANGSLTLGSVSGITFAEGADGTSSMKIRGTEADLETALTGMTYVGADDFYGSETLTINLSDLGNSGTGGVLTATQQTVAITVNNVNDAPNLSATMLGTSGSPVSFTENGVPSFLFSGASVSDNETDDISQLVLTVTNLADGVNEKLVINGSTVQLTHGISSGISSVSVVGTTATVTITPSTALTLAEANTLVNNIRYLNTDSDATTTARAVTLTSITDDGGGSATRSLSSLSSYVGITPVNSEPSLSATTGAMVEYDENDAATSIFSSASADPTEVGQGFLSVQFTVTNVDDSGYELVTVDGSEFALVDAVSGTTTTNSYTYSVSMSGTTATVTVSGSLTTSAMESLINGIKYRHSGDNPTTTNHRVMAITSLQDDGGTASGGDDTAAISGISRMIKLTAVNDAPVAVGSLNNDSKIVGETLSYSTSSAFSDPESDTLTYTMSGGPAGISINSSTGVISGAPSAPGIYTVVVTATDTSGATTTQSFQLTVIAPAKPKGGDLPSQGPTKRGEVTSSLNLGAKVVDVKTDTRTTDALFKGNNKLVLGGPGRGGDNRGNSPVAQTQIAQQTAVVSKTDSSVARVDRIQVTADASGQLKIDALPRGENEAPSGLALSSLRQQPGFFEIQVFDYDAQQNSEANGVVYRATYSDGTRLPVWIEVNEKTGEVTGKPPSDFADKTIQIDLKAIDSNTGDSRLLRLQIELEDNTQSVEEELVPSEEANLVNADQASRGMLPFTQQLQLHARQVVDFDGIYL